jgi:hypothetical protein
MQKVWILNEGGVNGRWMFPNITAEKLIISTRNQDANDYRGISLYYPMWTHWDYKHKFYFIDGVAAERNGMGVPVLEEPPIVRQQSDRDLAALALENFRVGETAYMDLPNGYKLTLQGVSGAVRDVWPSIQHHDLLMARSALAHFINLDSYGQVLISEESQSLFLMAEEAEANEFIEVMNELIIEWCDYNYESIDRYPTLSIAAISGTRDLDNILKGVANLMTAGGLTYNVETENALRDDLGLPALPAEATPAGGGAISVDPDSQSKPILAPGEADPGAVRPGAAQQDTTQKLAFAAGASGARAIHLSGRPLREKRLTMHMSGSYDRAYLRRDDDGVEWTCMRRLARSARVPNPNVGDDFDSTDAVRQGYTHVLWRLGPGTNHCPQCLLMSRRGLMRLSELHIEPGSDDTYCGDACQCELEYRRAVTVKSPAPSQGTTKR